MKQGDITIQGQADRLPQPTLSTGLNIDMSSTADISVTGIGFKPSWLWVVCQHSTDFSVWGFSIMKAGATNGVCLRSYTPTPGDAILEGYGIYADCPSGGDYYARIKTFDSDGFTIEVGNPSTFGGTYNTRFMVFK